jgi:hypothetical protein
MLLRWRAEPPRRGGRGPSQLRWPGRPPESVIVRGCASQRGRPARSIVRPQAIDDPGIVAVLRPMSLHPSRADRPFGLEALLPPEAPGGGQSGVLEAEQELEDLLIDTIRQDLSSYPEIVEQVGETGF